MHSLKTHSGIIVCLLFKVEIKTRHACNTDKNLQKKNRNMKLDYKSIQSKTHGLKRH